MGTKVIENGRRKRKNKTEMMILVLLVICTATTIGLYAILTWGTTAPLPAHASTHTPENVATSESAATLEDVVLPAPLPQMNVLLNSANALLINFHSGEILHYQNGGEKMYPASLVKMMTALVAIENINNLNEMVILDEAIFAPIHAANATTAGFLPGESVRAIDLLFGLLLPSGAECAVGLATHVAGSENAFVIMMNDRANELGMNNTNFTNTTGLHDSNQYSTVADMATLLMYALGNETFKQIISTSRHSTADTGLRPGGITFHSTLFSRMASPEFPGGTILGGRTGFTDQAGQNLASFAYRNGSKYIFVTSGAQANGNHLTQALHIDDAFTMFGLL